MIAAHDPGIGIARSGNFRNHIVHLLDVPIRLHYQVHFRRPRANMIWNRQRSTPLLRRQRPGNGGQQRLGVAIRNGQHRNLGDARRFIGWYPPRIFIFAVGRSGIAGIVRGKIHHAAALHAVGVAQPAGGKYIAQKIAIIARIGIDDAAHRAVLGRHLRLYAAPGISITGDHNRTLYGNAQPLQALVVIRQAVIHIDQRRGNVAINRIGVVSRQLLALLIGGRVARHRRLLQLGDEMRRRY